MSLFRNLIGTTKTLFHIGGPSGNLLKNVADGLSVRNSTDASLQNLSVKAASGASGDHATSYMDLKDANALISFSFDGASAPSAGSNTGTYGFCHTTGGAYTNGEVYYDTGTELRLIKIAAGSTIASGSAVTGDVSLVANGIYCAHSSSAPYTWTLKGDGTNGGTGLVKVIEIPIGTSASYSSTSGIADGAEVLWAKLRVTTPYSSGATIGAVVDGTTDLTIISSADVDAESADTYFIDIDDGSVTASNEGVVTVNIGGAPAAGAGLVLVGFASTTLV